ncbi:MAG: response regulator, partial [Myxococcota bacterium]
MAILVVDDEAGVRFALGEVLEEAGYDVCAVASAAEAQHVLTERAAAVEVVLTDLVMEGMDGMALLTWCREQVPTHPVILMTARGSERIAVQALKSGAYDYLSKPFDVDAVVATVSRAVEAHALRRNKRTLAVERAVGHAVIADSDPFHGSQEPLHRLAVG